MQGLATFRLSTSPLHRHCYWSQQDELRTRIAGQRARPACAPALQVFRCVGAWMCAHTPGKRVSLVRTAAAPPFRLPSLLLVLPLSFGQLAKKLPATVRPHKLRPCFQVPTDSQGLLGSNISTTRGRQDMRFCVCGSPRGDLSHIAGLTLGRSRSDFSGANRRAQEPYMWGVGLTQQIA